jgi:hypothetical protein
LVNYQESVVQSIGTIGADKLVQFVKGCWPSLAEADLMFSKKPPPGVNDKSWHPSQEAKLLKDGRLKMTLKVSDNDG